MPDGNFDPEVTEDGRMRCVYCGRYFNPERIEKHQTICGSLKNARPKGVDGEPTQTNRKVFSAEAQRLGQGNCFVSTQKYEEQKRQKDQEAVRQHQKRTQGSAKWRREHEEFIAACRAGRGGSDYEGPSTPASPEQQHDGKVQCRYCARYFEPNAAERHIPICAKVVNKPKPPPSSPGPSHRLTSSSGHGRGGDAASPRGSGRGGPRGASPRGASPARPPPTPPSGGQPPPPRTASSLLPPRQGFGAPREPSGSSANAARSLRRNTSSGSSGGRLPELPQKQRSQAPGEVDQFNLEDQGSAPNATQRNPGSKPPPSPGPRKQSSAGLPRNTGAGSSGDGRSTPGSAASSGGQLPGADQTLRPEQDTPRQSGFQRLGLRRSAMMYRLLSQVPVDGLARELADSGTRYEAGDKEAMIEAILEQFA